MKEGLMKNTSLTAVAVAAGMMLSAATAFAADLGGNCCADLEERVAELEATAARKGTRKTSLEVWGQVNKIIIAWDDSVNRNTVLGVDNVNHSTRFGFRGNAKVNSELSAGYSIVVEWATGGRSTNVTQQRDKASIATQIDGAIPNSGFGSNDAAITMREANWWLESSRLGRVTVGRFVGAAGPQGAIDLGGIGLTVASGSESLITNLAFRTAAGGFTGYTVRNTTDNAGEYSTRQNGVMWTSPTLAGFSLTASYSGAVSTDDVNAIANYGPLWSLGLRYAGEFNGVRVASAIGYENGKGEVWTSLFATGIASNRPASTNLGYSLSLMHVATGLFAQGFYNEYTRGHDLGSEVSKDTARQWLIQGGIARNWFGVGNTALYGEFGKTSNGFNTFGLEGVNTSAFTGVTHDANKETNTMWGLGVQQDLDAAAMQLYLGYRHFGLSSAACDTVGGCKDIGIVTAGAKIRF